MRWSDRAAASICHRWRRPTVGKHSTGGVGDKVSIVLAPVVAACGVVMPKMSGRGLGHTGGTLDKLESIPGFRVGLSADEFIAVLREVGCAIVGQTADIAPADKVLYALRDVTATIESVPLISASVMSKKIAEGSQALVLDVKCGRGAFMKTPARRWSWRDRWSPSARPTACAPRPSSPRWTAPLGRAVGNALEIGECLEVLDGGGPADLRALVETLAARALELAGTAGDPERGAGPGAGVLDDGRARAKLRAMVAAQGGDPAVVDDPARLPRAPATSRSSRRRRRHGRRRGRRAGRAGRRCCSAPGGPGSGIRWITPPASACVVGPGDQVAAAPRCSNCTTTALPAWPRPAAWPPRRSRSGRRRRRPALVLAWVHRDGETLPAMTAERSRRFGSPA